MRIVKPDDSSSAERPPATLVHQIAIVIPVYQGEHCLGPLMAEIAPYTNPQRTPHGEAYRIAQVLLVHDNGPDRSDVIMEQLAKQYAFVTTIWLSRNFGQHPATLAGMARATADWVVTMDEDGQQDPADIANMLDRALEYNAQLVYARPANPPPHGRFRNAMSTLAKKCFYHLLIDNVHLRYFNSFRLLQGEIARSLAAYCGPNVYLDAALSWMVGRCVTCDVVLRREAERPSGYNLRKLASHFWRLLISSGTRPLRLIAVFGLSSICMTALMSLYVLWLKLTAQINVEGWTSLIIVISFFSGCILLCLGILAEYLGMTMLMNMGKPLYLEVSRPSRKKAA